MPANLFPSLIRPHRGVSCLGFCRNRLICPFGPISALRVHHNDRRVRARRKGIPDRRNSRPGIVLVSQFIDMGFPPPLDPAFDIILDGQKSADADDQNGHVFDGALSLFILSKYHIFTSLRDSSTLKLPRIIQILSATLLR